MSSEDYQMLAKTFEGLEKVLKVELETIGAVNVQEEVSGVSFSGSKEVLYKANFCCRTAIRVLRVIGQFKIMNSSELYHTVYHLNWSDYLDVSQSFAIYSSVDNKAFNNATLINLKVKDAIVDHFKAKSRKRPTLNTENPDVVIYAHASTDSLTLSIDSSGEPLNKRGYRVGQNDASMNEVMAAGILKLVGWDGKCDLYDTMCGSGTIPVEAALMARNIPPGMFRKEFAFEKWSDFDADLLEEVYNEDYEVPFEHRIYASDISPINIRVSEINAKNAGVLKDIELVAADFADLVPQSEKGMLVVNPPAEERKRDRFTDPVYGVIGDQLRRGFKGFKAWVFSNSEQGFKNIGLRPGNEFAIMNGTVEYNLRLFEMFSGAARSKENSSDRPFQKQRSANSKREQPGRRRTAPVSDNRGDRRSSAFVNSRNDIDKKQRDDFRKSEKKAFDSAEERRSKFHEMRRNNLFEPKKDSLKEKDDSGQNSASEKQTPENGSSSRSGKRPRTKR